MSTTAASALTSIRIVACAATAAVMLTSCGSGHQGQDHPEPEATEVTDEALGEALEQLVFDGLIPEVAAGAQAGSCLVEAVRSADLSQGALEYLVETSGDDYVGVVSSLADDYRDDAETLMSPALRGDFEACAEQAVSMDSIDEDTEYDSAEVKVGPAAQGEVDDEPTIDDIDDHTLDTLATIEPGLVTMFSSYAQDDDQQQIYEAAGECMATAVLDEEFSDETLMFIAEGRPLGTGDLAEHLPDEDGREAFTDERFQARLIDCVSRAQDSSGGPRDVDEDDTDDTQ